jgi:hypothetical protein
MSVNRSTSVIASGKDDLHVVVFDDERTFIASPFGSNVSYARNSEEFYDLIATTEIDVLLLDHDLGPFETSREACSWHVDGIRAGLFKVPQQVIVVTGNPVGALFLMDLYRPVVEYPSDLIRDPFGRDSRLIVR